VIFSRGFRRWEGGSISMNIVLAGSLASLAAGAMTAVGAIPVLFGRSVSVRAQDLLLGFAAGVMLAASFFSLIVPAIAAAESLYGGVVAGGGRGRGRGQPRRHLARRRQPPRATTSGGRSWWPA
jgi:hypothetical protein